MAPLPSVRCSGSKLTGFVLILTTLVLLSGCWVDSLNGLVEEGFFHSDPDVTADPGLVGAWEVTSDNCTTTLTITAKDREYELGGASRGSGCNDEGKNSYYRALLVKLDNHIFLDVSPRPDDVCEMCLPLHWIFLAKFDKDLLSLTPIDFDWLKKALEQKTVTLATMPGDAITLIAPAKELKAFCRKYGDNERVFVPVPGLAFKRKVNPPSQP